MARIRSVKVDHFLDDGLTEVSLEAHFLLLGLPCLADSAGRLEDRPRKIQALLFAYRPEVKVDALLSELVRSGHIQRYTIGGDAYIQILEWDRDQRPHKNEPESTIPPPPQNNTDVGHVAVPGIHESTQGSPEEKSAAGIRGMGYGVKDPDPSFFTSSPTAIAAAAKAIETGGIFPAKQTAIPGTEQPDVVPKKPTTAAAEFAGWARETAKPLLAPDAPDSGKLKSHQWAKLGEALKAHGTLKMQAAFRLYTGEPFWLGKGLPLGAFVSEWERWVAQVAAPKPPVATQRPAQKPGGIDFIELKRRAAEVAAQEAKESAKREEGRNGAPAGS